MKNTTTVGIGELLWDVFPERKVLGGAPANFAYHTSQLGCNGYAVSAIGDDLLGKEILDSLKEKQLNYLIDEIDYPTGTVQVTLDSKGAPQYEICENVAWDNIPFTERTKSLAENTQTVCFGSLAQRNSVSKESIKQFLYAMPNNSIKIFDINLRQHFYTKEIIHDSLELANILKINDEEVVTITKLYGFDDDNEQAVCLHLLEEYKLDVVILTKGAESSYVFTSNGTSYQPTPKVHVIDTVGAGDSFTAAFITAYMHGHQIADAHQLAVEISAYVCTQQGAMPKLPDTYLEIFRK